MDEQSGSIAFLPFLRRRMDACGLILLPKCMYVQVCVDIAVEIDMVLSFLNCIRTALREDIVLKTVGLSMVLSFLRLCKIITNFA